MVDNGTGLKKFESAALGMLLQVGLQLLKRFGQMQGDGDRVETIRDPAPAPAGRREVLLQKRGPPAEEQSHFLVLTADVKGVSLVKPEAL